MLPDAQHCFINDLFVYTSYYSKNPANFVAGAHKDAVRNFNNNS